MNDYAHTYADYYDDTGEEITITFFSHADNCFQYVCDGGYETLVDDVVISKRFGFIYWLVENDKIDKKKINKLIKWQEVWYGYEVQEEEYYSIYESLLMLLSISDNPIEFLISILK